MVLDNFDYVANKLEGAMTEAAEELANKGFDNSISLKNEILKNGGYAFLHM